jgi:hypothetical protein
MPAAEDEYRVIIIIIKTILIGKSIHQSKDARRITTEHRNGLRRRTYTQNVVIPIFKRENFQRTATKTVCISLVELSHSIGVYHSQ